MVPWLSDYFREVTEWLLISWAKTGAGTVLRMDPLYIPLPAPKFQHSDLLVGFIVFNETGECHCFGVLFWFSSNPLSYVIVKQLFSLPVVPVSARDTWGGLSQLWRCSAPLRTWTRLSQISPKMFSSCTPFYWPLRKALTPFPQIWSSFQWNICAETPLEMENSKIQVPFSIMIKFL